MDTSLANEILAKSDETGVIIPSNIHPGVFVQMAAHNNDINEETIDGKNTTHATTLVYQRKQNGPIPPRQIHANHSQSRSLDSARNTLAIEEVSLCGRRAPPTSFLGQIKMEWFQCNNQFLSSYTQDVAWMLLRLHPTSIFQESTSVPLPEQSISGWGAFHSRFFSEIPVSTVIGYCPMIHGSASKFSTIFTLMKVSQEVARRLQQDDSVITFDLAIYMKAKQIQLKFPEEFKNTVICVGGFHIALNYLSL